jgi:hypothetical protein
VIDVPELHGRYFPLLYGSTRKKFGYLYKWLYKKCEKKEIHPNDSDSDSDYFAGQID